MKNHEFVICHVSEDVFTTTKKDRILYKKYKNGLHKAYGKTLPFGVLRVTATENFSGLGITTRFAMQQL